jgi:hypothetical protein
MLKEPIDIIYGGMPCAGFANPDLARRLRQASRMRELTLAELDQVCSTPRQSPVSFAEFVPQATAHEQALATMMSLR